MNAKKASTQCSRLFHCLLLKSHGTRVFEALVVDMDQGTLHIHIDKVNIQYKIRLRDDPRIDTVVFHSDEMVLKALLKDAN